MNNEYTSTARKVGKKTRYEVIRGGQPFADRTTGREYTVAMLAKHSRAFSIECEEANVNYYTHRAVREGFSAEQRAAALAKSTARLSELRENKPDPYFDNEFILSWHSSEKTARVPRHCVLVGFVKLVQPGVENPSQAAQAIEEAIANAIAALPRDTVGISRDNLWQIIRIDSAKGPQGTNAAFVARQMFDAIVSRAPLCNFVYVA